jgi:hypothetical protein
LVRGAKGGLFASRNASSGRILASLFFFSAFYLTFSKKSTFARLITMAISQQGGVVYYSHKELKTLDFVFLTNE